MTSVVTLLCEVRDFFFFFSLTFYIYYIINFKEFQNLTTYKFLFLALSSVDPPVAAAIAACSCAASWKNFPGAAG